MNSVNKCYEILGVDPGATPEELKKAYRNLVKNWHPDRFLHNPTLQRKAEEKLREINEAYDRLQSLNSIPTRRPPRPSKPSIAYPTAGHRKPNHATPKNPAAKAAPSINRRAASWKQHCLWFSRAILQTVKDPWLIAVFILMLAVSIVLDWFYHPN